MTKYNLLDILYYMNNFKFVKFNDLLKQQLKNKQFKKAFDELELQYTLKRILIDKRIKEGLTQKQLAKKIGIKQPLISKLETGNYNPSIKFLQKIAKGLNAKLKISITQN